MISRLRGKVTVPFSGGGSGNGSIAATVAAVVTGAGSFALALVVLSLMASARTSPPVETGTPIPTQEPTPSAVRLVRPAADLLSGHVAVGVPLTSETAPLGQIHAGALVDVVAGDGGTAILDGYIGPLVSGAMVLEVTQAGDHSPAMLLDLPEQDAVRLGYAVRRHVPLIYSVRGQRQLAVQFPALTLDQARARLGLPVSRPTTEPTPSLTVTPIPTLTAMPTATPAPTQRPVSEVHFVTYDGVDLATVERRFDVSAQALQRANPMLDEASEPSPGTELVIPGLFGFSYRAQVGDTWQTLAAAYSLSADELARINGLPVDSPLPPGTTLLIPATVSAERAPAPSHQ